jgi:hypothetical protein
MKLPKLHIRDLFWLAALAAMGCGWWVDRVRVAHREGVARGNFVRYAPLAFEEMGERLFEEEMYPPLTDHELMSGGDN